MNKLKLTVLLTALVALPGLAWISARAEAILDETDPADALYRAGQKAIDEKKWSQAIDLFERVLSEGGKHEDAALYWIAYAQHKAGRRNDALSRARELVESYPESSWVDDAKALEVEIRGGRGPAPGEEEDEDLKLLALSGLMDSKPDKAMAYLERYLAGAHSPENKEKALFILAQTEELPAARKLLLAVAKGAQHAELRLAAIDILGSAAEDDRSLRGELLAIYRGSQDRAVKIHVLEALGSAEDFESLATLARDERDSELKIVAIHSLGNCDRPQAASILASLYSGDRKTKMAVIDAAGNLDEDDAARTLIGLFKSEQDRELRRHIVQRLADIDTDAADEFLDQLLGNL
jgi:hypothetical protein